MSKSKYVFVLRVLLIFGLTLCINVGAYSQVSKNSLNLFFQTHDVDSLLKNDYGLSAYLFRIKHKELIKKFDQVVLESSISYNKDLFFVFKKFLADQTEIARKSETQSHSSFIKHYLQAYRTPNGPCSNVDFEQGTLEHWTLYGGKVNNQPLEMIDKFETTETDKHHAITSAGTDVETGISMVAPDGGQHSMMLGNGPVSGFGAASALQTFTVDSSNALFLYSYAVILEDAGHSQGEMPFFKLNLYDKNGDVLDCGEFEVIVNNSLGSEWKEYDASGRKGFYKDWTTVLAPLVKYIGQEVTVEFIVGDCGQGGHYGYAYIDAKCHALWMDPSLIGCDDKNEVVLEAPLGAGSYKWSTGDTTQTYTATTEGTYTVELGSVLGAQCNLTLDVEVKMAGSVAHSKFGANPNPICAGEEVQFTDSSWSVGTPDINFWNWNFGDGSAVDSTQNPKHIFDSVGKYNVQLVASAISGQHNCYDTMVVPLIVQDAPQVLFDISTSCPGVPINFTNKSIPDSGVTITKIEWDIHNDGTIDSESSEFDFTFSSPGGFPVKLTVQGSNKCAADTVLDITVYDAPKVVFTCPSVCENISLNITNSSTIDSGQIVEYSWKFSDGTTDKEFQPAKTFTSEGVFDISLMATSDQGCTDSTELQVEVYPNPVVQLSGDTVCQQEEVLILSDITVSNAYTTNSINSVDWKFGDSSVAGGANNQVAYTFKEAGNYTYSIVATTNRGCVDSTASVVLVHPKPVPSFKTNNAAGCSPLCVTLENTSSIVAGEVVQFDWEFQYNGTSDSINPTICFENTTGAQLDFDITLLVTTKQGCSAKLTKSGEVQVYPEPTAAFVIKSREGGFEETRVAFENNSLVANQFSWDFGGLGESSNEHPEFIFPSFDGNSYNVCLVARNQYDCLDTVCKPISLEGQANIFVPNAFTPNGDRANDGFKPVMYGISEEGYEFTILDRWGQIIYQTDRIESSWSGNYRGKDAVVDAYVWKVRAVNKFTGEVIKRIGHVVLVK